MVAQVTQYNIFQQLTSARVVSVANLAGTYINGPLNNGVGATLTASSVGALTIDGVDLEANDRVLLAAQTNANENGIYIVSNAGGASALWVLTRAGDQQNIEQMKAGQFLSINAGSAAAGSMYVLVEPLPAQLGIDDVVFESTQSPGGGSVTFNNVTVTGVLTVPNEGLHILDTNASHDLVIKAGSNLTADRILTFTTGDAARNLTLGADVSLNQNLQIADSPVFSGVTLNNNGLHLLDSNASHDLIVIPGSDLTADRNFTLSTGDANRALDISAADVTISAFAATVLDDANAGAARATLGAQESANIKAGTTADIGGGGAGPISVAVAGLTAASVVVASIEASSNVVAVAKCNATATGFDITFDGDPGAACTVNYVAFIAAQ